MNFRDVSQPGITQNIEMKKHMTYMERCYAEKSPINEAEYAFDERTPLQLYDCLMPRLKEHRANKFESRDIILNVLNDNQAKARVLAIEREIKMVKLH